MGINKVAIVGAGIMGSGIAQIFASSGFDAHLVDVQDSSLQKAILTIENSHCTF